jgi:hypothetical protein
MTALAETKVFEPILETPHANNALGWAGCTVVATGLAVPADWYPPSWESEPVVYLGSTGEFQETSWPKMESIFGYYVVPAPVLCNGFEVAEYPAVLATTVSRPMPVTFGTYLVETVNRRTAASLESQRQERRATARLACQIHELVPDLSDGDLAALVGVSRITWRDWATGSRAARRGKRRRLLRLRRILELRHHIDPDGLVSHWLDSPVGTNLDLTPAHLLAEDRDQLVAILAARLTLPDASALRLDANPDLAELINAEEIDEAFRIRRQVYAADEESDS